VKLQISTLAAKLLVLSPASQPLRLLSRYVFSLARYDANYDVRDRTRMLVSLLIGLAPTLNGEENEEQEDRGGVVLRREQVKRVLFEGKTGIIENDVMLGLFCFPLNWCYLVLTPALAADEDHVKLGSLGVITGKDMRSDQYLPFWLEQGIESSLRDTEEDIPVVSFNAMSSVQAQRSLGVSHVGSPVVLTPTDGTPPPGLGVHGGGDKGPWTDLDKFYEDDDSEEDVSEDSDDEQQEQNDDVGDDNEDEDGEDGDAEEEDESE
jgi:AP-3 complex subunit beta